MCYQDSLEKGVRYGKIAEVFWIIGCAGAVIAAGLMVCGMLFGAPERHENAKTECLCVCDGGPDAP